MNKSFQFRLKKSLNKGFTTLEVLVSIIIALAFVSVAMQSFVFAIAIKVQAQEKQRANQLIQEDLEELSNLATLISEDHNNKCDPVAASGNTAYENGYAYELWEDIDAITEPTVNLLVDANGNGTGETLTLDRSQINDTSDPSPADDAPYRTLKINYEVKDSDDNVIAQRYVEVIPDVALQCP